MALRSALGLVFVIVTGCAPSASSPTPTVSASQAATTPQPSPSPSPSGAARLQVSDTPLPAAAGAYLLFQLRGETRLRAISYGAEVNGVLGAHVPSDAVWSSQSPSGDRYVIGTTIYHRDGTVVGALPWNAKQTVTWSSQGRFLCAIVPESTTAGARMRMEIALPGEAAKRIPSGATYSDNSVYRVLACDEAADRVVFAQFGQGVTATQLWVYRLSNGNIVRFIDYAGANAWVASNADGSMIAESVNSGGTAGKWTATIRSADDGAQLATVDDFVARGFSGDNAFVVGSTPNSAAVIEWKTGRKVWTAIGPYGGFIAEPSGRRMAVGIGFVGGSDQRDVYLVQPDGRAPLLPASVRVALLY